MFFLGGHVGFPLKVSLDNNMEEIRANARDRWFSPQNIHEVWISRGFLVWAAWGMGIEEEAIPQETDAHWQADGRFAFREREAMCEVARRLLRTGYPRSRANAPITGNGFHLSHLRRMGCHQGIPSIESPSQSHLHPFWGLRSPIQNTYLKRKDPSWVTLFYPKTT